jgi:hypothetical protein
MYDPKLDEDGGEDMKTSSGEEERELAIDYVEDEGPIEELEVLDEKKPKDRHSLDVRRAIENLLDEKRLRKELDYLFDEDFANEDEQEQ